MNEIFTFGDKAIELTPDEIQQVAESYNWPFEWQVATRLKTERDEARARIAELEAERDAAKNTIASLNERRGDLEAELKDERRWVDQHISERDGEELRANQCEAQLAAVRTALNAAPDSDVASLAETLVALIDSIPNVVNYVTSTLDSAARNSDGEWGEVHRGRAWSSINQLKGLKKRAYEALEGQDHEQD